MADANPTPYRSGLATGIGLFLVAGAILAIVDRVHAHGGGIALFGLWGLLALPMAIGTGLVLAAGNATWGTGWVRGLFARLRDDRDLDVAVSAILIAAVVVGGVLALVVAKASVMLVGDVQRKGVGGLLLGVVVLGLVPVLALAALPVFRVTRQLTAIVPAIGPIPRVVVLVLGAVGALVAAGYWIVTQRLDYRALDLGMAVAVLLPVIALVLALVFYGPAATVRERIPLRGTAVLVGLVVAIALPLVGLRGKPSEATVDAVYEHSYIGKRMIDLMRKFSDADHDGYSAFFGGPDCNDHDENINPHAIDIPDNGIDENCMDGDAHLQKANAPVSVNPPPLKAPASLPSLPSLSGRQNVIVVFVDTLRYDHLGVSGYKRDGRSLTPKLDELAKQSVVFTHAYSQAPNTPRSVPSFLTSRYPSQIKVDDPKKDYATIDDEAETLFEVLKPAGFTTIGESSHFYFCDHDKYPDTCGDVKNIGGKLMHINVIQGADLWDNSEAKTIPDSNHDSAGPRIIKKTVAKLDELAASKQKFAMIVHLFEPHSTYMEHPGMPPITEHGDGALMQKYDYEVAFEDTQIGDLLAALEKNGLDKTTTIVLMSDHGEAFGVHPGEAGYFHGMSLYNELLHVPLMFRIPGTKPAMRDDVVELVDMAPTIAALFGVAPGKSWMGRSLTPALAGGTLPPLPAFAEMLEANEWKHEAKSMITADAKSHVFNKLSESRVEIYDLSSDADERKNLSDAANAKELEHQLAQWIEGPLANKIAK